MKILQKYIWTNCLIIGIVYSILIINLSCEKVGSVDRLHSIEYLYKNECKFEIQFIVYNINNDLIEKVSIPSGKTILFNKTNFTEGPAPFKFENKNYPDSQGEFVKLIGENNKCVTYYYRLGDKIFDSSRYSNYSSELIEKYKYQLIYIINDDEFINSVTCEGF